MSLMVSWHDAVLAEVKVISQSATARSRQAIVFLTSISTVALVRKRAVASAESG